MKMERSWTNAPSLPMGGIYFFDHDVCDALAGEEDSVRTMPNEESVDHVECLQAEPEGEIQVPHVTGVIYEDDGDVSI